MGSVYLDYAATAPLLPEVRERMAQFLGDPLGNPSSLHAHGRRARMALEEARERCAAALGVLVEEIVFTSGGTESDNLALVGVLDGAPPGSHFLVSAVEHPAVLERARILGERHRLEVIPVDPEGRVSPDSVAERLRADTALVSVMAANNEVGTLQPVAELGALCRQRGVLFHVDAVQHPGLQPDRLGIDLMSLSGHKLGALPGSGLLFVRRGVRLAPLLRGGGQEDHRRAGTPSLPAAVSLGLALSRPPEGDRLEGLRAHLERGIAEGVPGARLLAGAVPRVSHLSAWLFDRLPAEPILVRLDLEGISASSGSACSSHSLEPSRVLQAMGWSEEESRGLVRFSLGWGSQPRDVDRLLETLPGILTDLLQARLSRR
ncbi:MAG: cysteine desulfurase family protein [Candidatus Eremiobacterota bacterium]